MSWADLIRRVRSRRLAYRRCLLDDTGRPTADGELVLRDLARFCYAHRAAIVRNPVSGAVDPVASAVAQGRHEVWLRLCEALHLDDRYLTNAREDSRNDDE